MGGELIGHHAGAHIFAVGQGEVFLRGYVAEHRCAEPADLRCADGRRDVVVAGRDVRDKRAERVERRVVALFNLALHIFAYFVHRHMAGPFYKCLYTFCPGTFHEFAHRVEFGKLCFVVRVVN